MNGAFALLTLSPSAELSNSAPALVHSVRRATDGLEGTERARTDLSSVGLAGEHMLSMIGSRWAMIMGLRGKATASD